MPPAHSSNSAHPGLFFRSRVGAIQPLPDWSNWFLDLGHTLGSTPCTPGCRTIIAVSVPSRAYAAVFAGLGIVLSRAALQPAALDSSAYFEFLRSQPLNTRVLIYRQVKGKLKGFYGLIKGSGTDKTDIEKGWGPKITVLYNLKKNLKECASIRLNDCRQVLIAPEEAAHTTDSDLVQNQHGFSVIRSVNFFEALITPEARVDFLTGSRLDCTFVSNRSRIEEEMGIDIFAGPAGDVSGKLYDLLRPQNLSAYTKSYRSFICSSEKKSLTGLNGDKPCCAVFDTATGFLKWGAALPAPYYLVILDRSEPHYALAMETLNNRYLQRLPDAPAVPAVATRPAGTEVLQFSEKI